MPTLRIIPDDSLEPLVMNMSVKKKDCGDDVNEVLSYAYEISGDRDFIKMLVAENGRVQIDTVGVSGDIGFCQVAPQFHPEITNDSRFLTDWRWQIEQCYELYKNGTTFYGIKHLENDPVFNAKVESLLTFS